MITMIIMIDAIIIVVIVMIIMILIRAALRKDKWDTEGPLPGPGLNPPGAAYGSDTIP
jgi:heme/copper-type cytochrome/quinol oxidase subunit 2